MTLTRDVYVALPLPIENALLRLFPKRDAQTVFDIGSCEGEDAIRYSQFFPSATVYAFEPLPENVRLLRENLIRRHNHSVRVFEVALSDHPGRAAFHVSSGAPAGVDTSDWDYGNKSSSLLAPQRHLEVHPWVRFDREIEVETDTIERICEREGIKAIDFIHLDVQGAELMVLAGAGTYLERIGAVWLEVEAIPLYEGQPLKGDVERFMAAHGFERMLSVVDAVSGDQLYFNPRILGAHRDSSRIPGRMLPAIRDRIAATSALAVSRMLELLRHNPGVRGLVRVGRRLADRVIFAPIRERRAIDHWRRSGSPLPPPPAFKQRTVRSYGRALGFKTLIESGTYLGDMVEAQRGEFRRIWSIELSAGLHREALKRFSSAENVILLQGDSGDVMPSVVARLDDAALFWLDGHFSAGTTARGSLETPIRRELEAILSSTHDHCVLIDDARCFGAGDYPTLDEIRALVHSRHPTWSCIIKDDIIRIHPGPRLMVDAE